MSYRGSVYYDMALDAGAQPGSDEAEQLAALAEYQHQQEFERWREQEQAPDPAQEALEEERRREETMIEYHKIQTVWLRDPETKFRSLLEGQWARPEFGYLAECAWSFTEKVDGTNIRVLWDGSTVEFRGKTDRAQLPGPLLCRLQERFTPEVMGDAFDGPACLYGEGYGAKIQKGGGNYRSDQDFVLFDVRVGEWWLRRVDVGSVSEKLGCDAVPVVGEGTLHDMIARVRSGMQSRWGSFPAEGIVARPVVELQTRSGERIITKLKVGDFS